MKVIENIEELVGKTISKAVMLDGNEIFGLLFTDDTYCSITLRRYGDSFEIELSDEDYLDLSDLRNLGVISKAEFERQKEKNDHRQAQKETDYEIAQYQKLKAKFEGSQ